MLILGNELLCYKDKSSDFFKIRFEREYSENIITYNVFIPYLFINESHSSIFSFFFLVSCSHLLYKNIYTCICQDVMDNIFGSSIYLPFTSGSLLSLVVVRKTAG